MWYIVFRHWDTGELTMVNNQFETEAEALEHARFGGYVLGKEKQIRVVRAVHFFCPKTGEQMPVTGEE
jgi:hypothetical protein